MKGITSTGKVVALVRKRCTVCGHDVHAKPKDRICQQWQKNAMGFRTGWRCPGVLRRIVPVRAKAPADAAADMAKRGAAYRKKWEQRRSATERRLTAQRHKLARLEGAIRRNEARLARFTARSLKTDLEVEAMRDRMARAHQVQRARRNLLAAAGITPEEQS
jgi:hypothetical protein